jgi:hypothetical protein
VFVGRVSPPVLETGFGCECMKYRSAEGLKQGHDGHKGGARTVANFTSTGVLNHAALQLPSDADYGTSC